LEYWKSIHTFVRQKTGVGVEMVILLP